MTDLSNVERGASSSRTESTELCGSLVRWWRGMPATVFKWALAIDAIFLALYVLSSAFARGSVELVFLLSLEAEGNPPSWWYGSQQLLVALAFLLLASQLFASDERIRRFRSLFLVSGLGFGFISLDEVGEVHEIGSRALVRFKALGAFTETVEHSVFHIKQRIHGGGTWIVVYAIIGIALLFWLVPQIIKAYKVWPKEVGLVAIGFGIFAFSAAVLQVVGYFTKVGTLRHYVYVFVEQGLKMGGMSIALFGVLLVLSAGAIRLTEALAGTTSSSV
ncbi:MAG: hypothetical protein P4L93_04505 [Coriobacteriia bacterium]|nr:hypothetical protein [Coriobacteriia bacterium]